ncbi:MAG: TRAP transporter TatT component family protein [Kofleriaceae bacterium]
MIRLAALLALATSCGGFIDDQAAKSTYRIISTSIKASQREADVELARDALPGGLMQLEAFAIAYPKHGGFRALHTDALCGFAIGFVFDDWEDATLTGRETDAAKLTERLQGLVERCIAANTARLPTNWRTTFTGPQAPAALWIASAEIVRLAQAPFAHAAELPAIRALLERSAAVAPGLRDGEAELLLATLAALTGGDSTAAFARARAAAGPGALIVDTMLARTCGDRALFRTTLERVIATDPAAWPDRRLANELARRKARRYLTAIDTLVPGS